MYSIIIFNQLEIPPKEGLKFARNSILVKLDKHYLIKLFVNAELIAPGSLIQIENNGEYVTIGQKQMIFTGTIDEEVPYVLVDLFGEKKTPSQQFVVARCGSYESTLYYDVDTEAVHIPSYGFDFYPNEMHKKPEVMREATMYVDTNKFSLGSEIKIENNNADLVMWGDNSYYCPSLLDISAEDINFITIYIFNKKIVSDKELYTYLLQNRKWILDNNFLHSERQLLKFIRLKLGDVIHYNPESNIYYI